MIYIASILLGIAIGLLASIPATVVLWAVLLLAGRR